VITAAIRKTGEFCVLNRGRKEKSTRKRNKVSTGAQSMERGTSEWSKPEVSGSPARKATRQRGGAD